MGSKKLNGQQHGIQQLVVRIIVVLQTEVMSA
jgi:hypothetical protein